MLSLGPFLVYFECLLYLILHPKMCKDVCWKYPNSTLNRKAGDLFGPHTPQLHNVHSLSFLKLFSMFSVEWLQAVWWWGGGHCLVMGGIVVWSQSLRRNCVLVISARLALGRFVVRPHLRLKLRLQLSSDDNGYFLLPLVKLVQSSVIRRKGHFTLKLATET